MKHKLNTTVVILNNLIHTLQKLMEVDKVSSGYSINKAQAINKLTTCVNDIQKYIDNDTINMSIGPSVEIKKVDLDNLESHGIDVVKMVTTILSNEIAKTQNSSITDDTLKAFGWKFTYCPFKQADIYVKGELDTDIGNKKPEFEFNLKTYKLRCNGAYVPFTTNEIYTMDILEILINALRKQ